jgi:hypothetical protein
MAFEKIFIEGLIDLIQQVARLTSGEAQSDARAVK